MDRDDEVVTTETCVICDGPLVPLGRLGNLDHYRCRNCGHEQSKDAECPTCEGPVGPAGRQFMYDRPCEDPCHDDAPE